MRAEPWMNRTPEQADADELDCDLFRLIVRAERKAAAGTPNDRRKWQEVAIRLRAARIPIRAMMHRDDVAQTE